MSKFGWNEKMALGIESIDREHQKLFEMIDQLQKAMTKVEQRLRTNLRGIDRLYQ